MIRRMTVKEHCDRVRFDTNLIEQYIPNNKFKKIYPIDSGCGGISSSGDDLEETYLKIEKAATHIWKLQCGMIKKVEKNPHINDPLP